MSAVRFFDNIPHIVRYGMHDDKGDRSWIWFWRCGVRFTIHADGKDFGDNTDFYNQWKPLIREHPKGKQSMAQFAETQWHPLCDLVISTAMSTLQRLAPDREYLMTLRDYLHTPVYRLRLIASEDRTSIETKIEEGPTYPEVGAYDMKPVSRAAFLLPEDLPIFQSSELRVLGMDIDWRQRPAKVCSTSEDDRVFSFLACEQDVRRGGRDAPVVNYSIDHIRSRLEKLRTMAACEAEEAEGVCGVVMDYSPLVSGTASQDGEQTDEADGSREQRVAGLLLPWVEKE